MKKIIIISLSILIGCSEIGIIEKEIPFERKTVVYGRLEGGSEDLTLNFSRSFGLNEIYSKDDVSLVGVTAYIWSDVYGIFPLKDYGKGEYRPPNDFLIQFGEHYELHAKIENERIFSSTYVPHEAEVISVDLVEDFIVCKVNSESKVVYGCKYHLQSKNGNSDFTENTFYEISEEKNQENTIVEIRTKNLPDEYFIDPEEYRLDLELFAFDADYNKYYYSRENNKPIENVFSEGGGAVFWNIQGENAIGTFFGYSKVHLRNIKFN